MFYQSDRIRFLSFKTFKATGKRRIEKEVKIEWVSTFHPIQSIHPKRVEVKSIQTSLQALPSHMADPSGFEVNKETIKATSAINSYIFDQTLTRV